MSNPNLEMTSLKNRLLKKGEGGLPPRPNMPETSTPRKDLKRKIDYTPRHWSDFFTSKKDIELENKDVFCVYEHGTEGPVVLFLHGGGYSGLSFALSSVALCERISCRCIAMDIRGHGDTWTSCEFNLSVDTLANDVGKVLQKIFPDSCPPVILVGHSMGGAVAVHASVHNIIPSQQGLAVIDVVEGTAIDSLTSMQSFLASRPATFPSLAAAIEWSLRHAQLKNAESARVSIPGHLQRIAASEAPHLTFSVCMVPSFVSSGEPLLEEEEEEDNTENRVKKPPERSKVNYGTTSQRQSHIPSLPSGQRVRAASSTLVPGTQLTEETNEYAYKWRIDLTRTEKYWRGWFEGLTNKFLSTPVPKLLLLAGMDRLDKDLTIGQMQGKFQLHNFPNSGHAIHEDVPEKFADALATFMVRNKFATAKSDMEWVVPAC